MTWHTDWQERFPQQQREVSFTCLPPNSKKPRRADVFVSDKTVVEFQHSHILSDEIRDRNSDYNVHGKHVIWLIDGTFGIILTPLKTSATFLIEFESAYWRYNNFKEAGCTVVYLNVGDYVYCLPLAEIRCNMIDVRDQHDIPSFVNWLGGVEHGFWNMQPLPQCTALLNLSKCTTHVQNNKQDPKL